MNIIFNACLQCAAIALYASGYRTSGEGHHERIINSLKFTLPASDDLIGQLNRLRRKRITASYDKAGSTSEQEVKEAIDLARNLAKMVRDWLSVNHPTLLK